MWWCFSQHTSKLDVGIFPVLFHMIHQMYACMSICIGQTSLQSVTLRMQSSTWGAESHFFGWLPAVHKNNNCSAFITLRNNFLYFRPTEDGERKFIFIFEFCKITVEQMNERIVQLIYPPLKLKVQAWAVFSGG